MKPEKRTALSHTADETLQVQIPAATKRALLMRAAETGTPMRVLVLDALKAAGFPVPQHALVDRRKNP